MKDSRRRVWVLFAWYGLAVAGVLLFLASTMLRDNEKWLHRSYANRWAFRDVPTKRGAIRDRRGVVIVRDVPTSALEIHYWSFRRYHPCGAAVYAANLALAADGEAGRFAFRFDDVPAAFRRCLGLQLSYLRQTDDNHENARDLRFYLCSLYAALTDGSRYAINLRLQRFLDDGRDGTICALLALEPSQLMALFHRRVEELNRIAWLLPEGRDLWKLLRTMHESRQLWLEMQELPPDERASYYAQRELLGQLLPRDERVPRSVERRLPYEDARYIATLREWHPGLFVRPSVDRVEAESHAGRRFESLVPLLGRVTTEWAGREDKDRRTSLLQEVRPDFERMAEADLELSDELRDRVTRRLRATMSKHLAVRGRVGRSGVEADMDKTLRGTAGVQWLAKGRGARELGIWASFDVAPGGDVYLTVDLRLQHLLEQAVDEALAGFPDKVSAMAVIDPHTGDILAVVGRPAPADRQRVWAGRREPAVSWPGNGEIGSISKPLILLEHLDALRKARKALHHREFEPCPGRSSVKSRLGIKLRCDHHHGDVVHDCVEALGVSCNAFFFQAAVGMGEAGVVRAFRRFGLYLPRVPFATVPAPFQRHVSGLDFVADPTFDTRRKLHKRAIGYGIEANVLQIARAYAGLATGQLPELSIVVRDPSALRSVPLGVNQDDLDVVREGMKFCVEHGTGENLGLVDVWAKTGTAEVSKRGHNNAWFAGFVYRRGRPRFAFASVIYLVMPGQYGAAMAGPMIQRFLELVRGDPVLSGEYL